jgi:hypothetical protein
MQLGDTLLKEFGDIAWIGRERFVPVGRTVLGADGAVNPASRTAVGAASRRRAPAPVAPSTEPARRRWRPLPN